MITFSVHHRICGHWMLEYCKTWLLKVAASTVILLATVSNMEESSLNWCGRLYFLSAPWLVFCSPQGQDCHEQLTVCSEHQCKTVQFLLRSMI